LERLDNPRQVQQWLEERERAYGSLRDQIALRGGIDACYYEGAQWLAVNDAMKSKGNFATRLFTNWNPDSSALRATVNIVSQLTQKSAAATFPSRIEVDGVPGDAAAGGIDASRLAQVAEDAVNTLVDHTGYLHARREANMRRCIWGTYGVGLSLAAYQRNVRTESFEHKGYDCVLKAFTFEPTRLVLDPDCHERCLDRHEYVIFESPWTVHKIRRVLGIELDETDLYTIGQLTPMQQNLNRLSQNRLFSAYKEHSETRGAMVCQIHRRDGSGRFGEMIVAVKVPKGDPLLVNEQDRRTPFGGTGMPLELLHAHMRADTMWSISDVSMLKDTQDRTNLSATMLFRMMQKSAGYQILVPEGAAPHGMSDEEYEHLFHNTVGGIIRYKPGTKDRPVPPPQLIQHPQPQSFYQEMINQYRQDGRDAVHRSEGHFGATKSHVPDATFRAALEEGDQVHGIRVQEDMDADNRLLGVALATLVRHVQAQSPNLLGMLTRAGFDEDDFAVLLEMDPDHLPVSVRVREASLRYRSHNAKRQDLLEMVQLQALPPGDARFSLARDLDRPLTETDRTMVRDAEKAALAVLAGQEWAPRMLGPYTQVYTDAFRRAMTDRRARLDPGAMARLERAIMNQTLKASEEALMSQPPTAGEPGAAQGAGGAQQQLPEEAALATVLSALDSGGGGAPGVPEQTAAA